MAAFESFFFPSADGRHRCFGCVWLPDDGRTPRAVVQLVHGIAEYVERYDPFARFLADRGFAVTGEDHLGHGKTAQADGSFGCLPERNGWELMVEDVHTLRRRQEAAFPGVPYFLMGHSMGSFLARTYLIRHPGGLAGTILSGTGQEPAPLVAAGEALAGAVCALRGPDSTSALVQSLTLGSYNRQFAPNRTGADWISRDEAVVDAYLQDPLCTIAPTVGLFRAMLGGIRFIGRRQNLASMDKTTPVYLFSGDQDPVGSRGAGVEKVRALFVEAGCKDVTLRLYPGGRHEMLNETNRSEVWADTLAWMEGHL